MMDKAPKELAEQASRFAADYAKATEKHPARKARFSTLSDMEIAPLYTPVDARLDASFEMPGEYPFTRGVQPTMYRARPWTMRQFAGFGSPEETNARFKYLLGAGVDGLSTAFDMPALMGYDCDHPMSEGEVGKEGVSVSSLADMEVLFGGIGLDQVSTSMTINAPAIVAMAMYIATAEKQGVKASQLRGTIQNDMLKEFIAQKEWVTPPDSAVKLSMDIVEYCTAEAPQFNPISISGYHIREAGAKAAQEMAFTIADGVAYVQHLIDRGMDVDTFAPRLSFFWDVHNDFFEEIAKFRAGRRVWARLMRERFGAKNPRSWMLRTHAQTAGVSLTAQQPYNNVVRTAIQALAAVVGGTQSLHTNSLDETYALPTEAAVTIALRTQQIIAEESGVGSTVDPFGGAYFVEALTDKMEAEGWAYIEKIDAMGGMLEAVKQGYPQKEIAESAFRFQRQVETDDKSIVGVNIYARDEQHTVPTLVIHPQTAENQTRRLTQVKAQRDAAAVKRCLSELERACRVGANTFPAVLDCVRAYVTLGEICDTFRAVWGVYTDPAWM